jgi:type I restriction enzyme, S subunit
VLIDVRPDLLAEVQRILSDNLPPGYQVFAFGSRVTWTAKDTSDLDLCIKGPKKLGLSTLAKLKDAFSLSRIPYKVDVVDWHRIDERFQQMIEPDFQEIRYTVDHNQLERWETCRLGDVTTWLSGGTPLKNNPSYWLGDIPWISAVSMNTAYLSTSKSFISEAGLHAGSKLAPQGSTLILVRGGALNNKVPICFAQREVAFNQDVKAVIPNNRINHRFLFFWFLYQRDYLLGKVEQTGIGAGKFDTHFLQNLAISLPSLGEQEKIVKLLGALDDKIELNRQMNQTLEAMARALFQDWFVDFGPTRAKMEGREPYLAPEVWALFPDRLDETDLPEGWEQGVLHQLVKINPSESLRTRTQAPYLDMAALPTSGPSPATPVIRAFTSGTKFRNGDTLLARITPCLENGKTAFIQCLDENAVGWGSTEFIVMRSISPVPNAYTYVLARDPAFRNYAIQSMTGTSGRQRARSDAIANYPIAIPTKELWEPFSKLMDAYFTQIHANACEVETLSQIRDLLLPKLMSGELTLTEAETQIDQALSQANKVSSSQPLLPFHTPIPLKGEMARALSDRKRD